MRRALIALLVLALLVPVPVSAGALARCDALTAELNKYRPDLRVRWVLCSVGYQRSYEQWKAGRIWHDLTPLIRKLTYYGICWRMVGEVTAWTTASPSAWRFMRMWRGSDSHWSLLTARRYDRGGGSWYSADGRSFSTYYVIDLCG